LGIDLGWGLQAALAGSHTQLIADAVGDTGLAEPWYYNWPAQLVTDLATWHPAVVVVFLGANDVQNFYVGNQLDVFGSPSWARTYGGRVAEVMDEAVAAGARVLWLGMPVMADQSFSQDMAVLNSVYAKQAAAHRPHVAYFSTWPVLSGPGGTYREWATGPGGAHVELRDPDGVHIATGGADVLGRAVVAQMAKMGWR
jgi:hypothetical protein